MIKKIYIFAKEEKTCGSTLMAKQQPMTLQSPGFDDGNGFKSKYRKIMFASYFDNSEVKIK